MENYYKIQIGPQVLDTLIHYVDYSGDTVGYYSSVTAMMSGGTSGTSLFTGMTIPVLLTQTAVDCGFYSVFDGNLLQQDAVTNFLFSATTSNPYTYFFYNTSQNGLRSFIENSSYSVDWGDGSSQTISTFYPEPISHEYPESPAFYTITLTQNNQWGTISVEKQIQVPYTTAYDPDPTGIAYFTSNVGSWSATPISYAFVFSGDAENSIEAQSTKLTNGIPNIVSGSSKSELNSLRLYGPQPFLENVPVIKNGTEYGSVTEITPGYTAYTIQGTNYIDYIDGTTIYVTASSGLTSDWLQARPIVKDELLLKTWGEPVVSSSIIVDRGKSSPFQTILRIAEVDNVGDLEKYGYGFFNVKTDQ